MKLEDFRQADCRLFRVPAIDISSIEGAIETAIVNSWRGGYANAHDAVNGVINNSAIVKNITQQIGESLSFQRENAEREIEAAKTGKISQYEQEQNARVRAIEEDTSKEIGYARKSLKQTQKKLEEKSRTYDAFQASLEERRAKIKQKLSEIGGEEAVETLFRLNQDLLDPVDKPVRENKTYTESIPQKKYSIPRAESRTKRVAKKIWSVLNYRIW
jgi:hypothetical protein